MKDPVAMQNAWYQIKAAFYGFIVGGLLGTCPITTSMLFYEKPPVMEVAYAVAFVVGGSIGLSFALLVAPFLVGFNVSTILLVLSAGTLLGAIPMGLLTTIPFFSLPGGILGFWVAFFLLMNFKHDEKPTRRKSP